MGMKCLRAFLSLIPLELNDSPRSGSNWLSDMDWLTYHHTKRAVLQFLSRPRPLEGEVHSWLDASYSIHISALTPRFEISASACQWSGLILCRRKLSLWLFLSSSWSEYLQTWLPSSRMDVEDKTDKYFDTALIRGRWYCPWIKGNIFWNVILAVRQEVRGPRIEGTTLMVEAPRFSTAFDR